MSDHCIGGGAAGRSTSANRLLQAMNQIMAPLFAINADRTTVGCAGPNECWS